MAVALQQDAFGRQQEMQLSNLPLCIPPCSRKAKISSRFNGIAAYSTLLKL